MFISELSELDRIPAYIQRVIQESETDFTGQYWSPPDPYQWKHEIPKRIRRGTETLPYSKGLEGLRIYEAHVGMAQEGRKGWNVR